MNNILKKEGVVKGKSYIYNRYNSKYEIVCMLTKEEIEKKVSDLGGRITSDYKGEELVIIGALKGAFVFVADLIRNIHIPIMIDFVRVSSYGSKSSPGDVKLEKGIKLDITNKNVLVVEDIIDTGLTLIYLLDYLRTFNPCSIKICTMIDKPERRMVDLKVDYVGHIIKKGFLVGYGLDYNEMCRELPDVYHLKL